jgi:hypothetical protein
MEEDEREPNYGDLTEHIIGNGTRQAGNSKGYQTQSLHAEYDATCLG